MKKHKLRKAYQLILVRCYCDEGCWRESEVSSSFAFEIYDCGIVILLSDDMDSRLVLVHRIQYKLNII